MAAIGGIFHQRADAQQAADALTLAGVSPESIRFAVLPRSPIDVLGPLGIPSEAIADYEWEVGPGDILLTVTSDALPDASIAHEIAHAGGLVVQFGRAPAGGPGER